MEVNIAIKGGLGNQLFQYALGVFLKQKYNCAVRYDILPLDKKEKNLTKRSFLLDRLFTGLKFTGIRTHKLINTNVDTVIMKLYKKTLRTFKRYTYISETAIAQLDLKPGHTYYLDGYWQSAQSAKHSLDAINACATAVLKNNPYLSLITAPGESVAIHIRRGDYVNNAFINSYHGNCGLDYYLNAMKMMESRVSVTTYFIFSDDLKWAAENIKSTRPLVFVEGDNNEPVADLFLMKSCRHQVISNSSFSCWASYLNTNPGKIVIAPQSWTKKEKTNTMPLFENTWILI